MLSTKKGSPLRFFALTHVFSLFLLFTFANTAYAVEEDVKSIQDINEINFALNSITLSNDDMPIDSMEISSSVIDERTTGLHLLTPEFLGRLDTLVQSAHVSETISQYKLPSFIVGRAYTAMSSENNIIVGNYNYSYPDVQSAKEMLSHIRDLVESDGMKTVPQYTSESQIAISLLGEENDSVYWYISTKDNMLMVLHTNGITKTKTFQALESAIEKVSGKEIAKLSHVIYLPAFQDGFSNNDVKSAGINGDWRGPAYMVAFTHNDPSWVPHYGAWFIGSNGRSPYFICWYQPSGYGSWHWWGNNRNVLLLSKTWLFSVGQNGWRPGCHYAVMQR